jgi:hypothetical protein
MKRKLLSKIYKLKNQLPNWIDTKLRLHYDLWNIISECNNVIVYNLLIDEILSDDELEGVIEFFDIEIRKGLNLGYDLEIAVYYEILLTRFMNELLDFESYEAAYNLKYIMENYFEKKYQDPLNEN